jgi:hypothetical protein
MQAVANAVIIGGQSAEAAAKGAKGAFELAEANGADPAAAQAAAAAAAEAALDAGLAVRAAGGTVAPQADALANVARAAEDGGAEAAKAVAEAAGTAAVSGDGPDVVVKIAKAVADAAEHALDHSADDADAVTAANAAKDAAKVGGLPAAQNVAFAAKFGGDVAETLADITLEAAKAAPNNAESAAQNASRVADLAIQMDPDDALEMANNTLRTLKAGGTDAVKELGDLLALTKAKTVPGQDVRAIVNDVARATEGVGGSGAAEAIFNAVDRSGLAGRVLGRVTIAVADAAVSGWRRRCAGGR